MELTGRSIDIPFEGVAMRKYTIVTESGADLPQDLAALHQIHVLPMHVVMDDMDYQDGSIPVTQVYDYHKRTQKIPSTSAINPDEYKSLFQKIFADDPETRILHIAYTSKASCTYQNALIASAGMKNIDHIDSLNVSGGETAIVMKAVELIENDPDIQPEELIARIKHFVTLARVSFIPGDLEYLKAGGRLSNAAYLGAMILQLKPLIEIVEGKLIATKKYRGSMGHIAEKYLNDYFERYSLDKERLYLLYSLGLDETVKQRMEDLAKEKGIKKVIWIQTGCVISTHSGPGAIGAAGFEILV